VTSYTLCGGSWFNYNSDLMRTAFRDNFMPDIRFDDLGFRTALHLRKDSDL